jgi:hypothetical protein
MSPGYLMSSLSLHPYSGDTVRKHSNLASLTSVLPFHESVHEESCDFSTYHMFLSEQTPGRLGLLKAGPRSQPFRNGESSCVSPRHHYCELERGWPGLWDDLRATHGQSWRVQGQGVQQPRGGKMADRHSPCGPHLRLSLFVHPVDLAPNKHSDLAFAPSLLAVQEIGDEEGET